ncbi:ATP-grasp domain-containing protein [Leptospira bandrabouensis]|uniref:ATP-grasp domain-containing protein n=1 Tax=Leptospira bandrabouensis TaxID=2484903 RepID=UPI00223D217D|nr:ATP-grasp domain-containing protein [Leptospira bandrabouensis]MCW7460298.1 ATP-grasp domain-containing protein [Leptospira bandrabouensis]MCW7477695.1 ATP-grasp domain-containing protein [Leptospira bandrabouensis]MCW7485377.1 ATP-grasp domain-containing protein [Leptospira bandrabouensis]
MRQLTGSYLSIGAGENQIPLIQAAKARGLKVISVDTNPEAPGLVGSDIRILESTHEYRKILHAMSRVPLPFKLMGVGSRSFGKAIYTVSYLAEKLKLRGNPRDTVNLFLDKEKFKNSVQKYGIPLPASLQSSVSSKSKEKKFELSFPLIAKPKEGSGKKGITVLESEADYKKFTRLKTSESYLLEPFIHGDEITVLGFVIARRFYLVSLTDKITTGKPNFIEVAHVAPSQHIDMAGEIKMICQAVVTATKLKTGPFVAEFKITKNKECLLIESAPEVGGEFLADVLIPEHYGYKYFNDLLSVTIGEKTRPGFLKKAKDGITKSALVFTLPPERQKKMGEPVTLEPNAGETVFFQKQLVPSGATLDKLEGNHKRTQVFGISTKLSISTKDWLDSIFQRIDS